MVKKYLIVLKNNIQFIKSLKNFIKNIPLLFYAKKRKILFEKLIMKYSFLIHEEIMVFTKTMMENFNSPSDVIALTMDEMQKNHSFSWMAIVQNYANALLRNAIFGLIIALIFKKS